MMPCGIIPQLGPKKTFFCKILYVFDETGDCLDEKNIQTKFLRDFSHNLGKKVLVH